MSIELNWETLTSGPDGDALAERIRAFIHDKFQTVPLPRFIRSVNVHGFDFGSIPPELELKDITDPLPDFYEQELDEDESDDGHEPDVPADPVAAAAGAGGRAADGGGARASDRGRNRKRPTGLRSSAALRSELASYDVGSPFLGTSTPGIRSGPGRSYFQGHLGTGTQTPLAAVAGAHLGHGGWRGPAAHGRHPSQGSVSVDHAAAGGLDPALREKSSVSTLAPTSVGASRPPTRDPNLNEAAADEAGASAAADPRREPRVEDVQAVFRIRYAGDVRLNLTAKILLDYPMPSFVEIPIKLSITGLSFDGVGVLAHIRKRVHFCFLSPGDALMAVGPDDVDGDGGRRAATHDHHHDDGDVPLLTATAAAVAPPPAAGQGAGSRKPAGRFAGLLQEVKVESEIGERDGGKQSLKNVGKVERFVLEQVRRIFEEEFVYPSFWTFLV